MEIHFILLCKKLTQNINACPKEEEEKVTHMKKYYSNL